MVYDYSIIARVVDMGDRKIRRDVDKHELCVRFRK